MPITRVCWELEPQGILKVRNRSRNWIKACKPVFCHQQSDLMRSSAKAIPHVDALRLPSRPGDVKC